MTRPHEGEAFIGVHADTGAYERELDQGIRKASRNEEDDLKGVGHDFGKAVGKGMGDELERSGPELVQRVEKGLAGKRVRWKVKTTVDKDNNVVRRVVEETFQDIEKAFNDASGPNGFFSKIGKGVTDAVGNAFNVSGSSPLIAFLIPVFGGIAALILGAVQGVNALIAIIGTLPALIAGVIVQVGVLFLAFKGLGTAISGAFAAKNAKELQAAIKDLAPAAQAFVKELLPLRNFFNSLAKIAQQNFFKSLGDVIPRLQKALGGLTFIGEFSRLAEALGKLFRSIALFFASPEFVQFVSKLFPAIMQFLRSFGPDFVELLKGLTEFSTAILPFLNFIGTQFSDALFELGAFLARTARDPAFKKWLDDMATTVLQLEKFFDSVINLAAVLLAQLNSAGGASLIGQLAEMINSLAAFFATDVGEKTLEGLIDASIILTKTLLGLVIMIGLLFASLEAFFEWVTGTAGPAIGEFFTFIGDIITNTVFNVGSAINDFFTMVGNAILDAWAAIKKYFSNFGQGVQDSIDAAIATVRGLPSRALAAVSSFKDLLFSAGANLIQGLINGMLSKLGPVRAVISNIAQTIRDHWPFSPAKEGPLSGSGDPQIAGQKTIQRFTQGMRLEIPALRSASSDMVTNIVFGPGAVRVDFNGQLPTQDQAERTGSAVGAGINGQLAARNTRLAVRTL